MPLWTDVAPEGRQYLSFAKAKLLAMKTLMQQAGLSVLSKHFLFLGTKIWVKSRLDANDVWYDWIRITAGGGWRFFFTASPSDAAGDPRPPDEVSDEAVAAFIANLLTVTGLTLDQLLTALGGITLGQLEDLVRAILGAATGPRTHLYVAELGGAAVRAASDVGMIDVDTIFNSSETLGVRFIRFAPSGSAVKKLDAERTVTNLVPSTVPAVGSSIQGMSVGSSSLYSFFRVSSTEQVWFRDDGAFYVATEPASSAAMFVTTQDESFLRITGSGVMTVHEFDSAIAGVLPTTYAQEFFFGPERPTLYDAIFTRYMSGSGGIPGGYQFISAKLGLIGTKINPYPGFPGLAGPGGERMVSNGLGTYVFGFNHYVPNIQFRVVCYYITDTPTFNPTLQKYVSSYGSFQYGESALLQISNENFPFFATVATKNHAYQFFGQQFPPDGGGVILRALRVADETCAITTLYTNTTTLNLDIDSAHSIGTPNMAYFVTRMQTDPVGDPTLMELRIFSQSGTVRRVQPIPFVSSIFHCGAIGDTIYTIVTNDVEATIYGSDGSTLPLAGIIGPFTDFTSASLNAGSSARPVAFVATGTDVFYIGVGRIAASGDTPEKYVPFTVSVKTGAYKEYGEYRSSFAPLPPLYSNTATYHRLQAPATHPLPAP